MARQHDEDELDDREMPDESDLHPDDAIDLSDPCPVCGKAVFDDAEICPHCHNFITHDSDTRRSPIVVIGLILLLIALLLSVVLW